MRPGHSNVDMLLWGEISWLDIKPFRHEKETGCLAAANAGFAAPHGSH
jgi:hypothetical protein